MIKRILATLALVIILLMASAIPVLAIDDPDTPPTINAVYVYEDLLETGDAGVLVDYYLDYTIAGIPDETVTEAYLVVFLDTDGVTQLKAVSPFAFVDKGYGRGLAWIYFSAAEVTEYAISSVNETLYRVWLVGNPTLDWDTDPPKTITSIGYWQPSGSNTSTLLSLRVISYANTLESLWGVLYDLVEATPLGSKLTTLGESYFLSVIPNLRTMAPSAFASGELSPTEVPVDYSTEFGATMTNGTGTVTGSPITLIEGTQEVTVTLAGTFTLELNTGTVGTVTNDTGVVTGSPVDIVAGTNTIVVTLAGKFDIELWVEDTQSGISDNTEGTGLDLTDTATLFGMSTMMFSSLVWLVISVIISVVAYRSGGERSTTLVFNICVIGGAVLGLMPVIMAALLFIGSLALTAFVFFYRGATH